jgi:hypothetical protein
MTRYDDLRRMREAKFAAKAEPVEVAADVGRALLAHRGN